MDFISKECYRNDKGNWLTVESMTEERIFHSMTTVGSLILVMGGFSTMEFRASVEAFDGLRWIKLPYKLSSPRAEHCVVPISSTEVVVIGGSYSERPDLIVEKYNIYTGLVSTIPSKSPETKGHACALKDKDIYISGGFQFDDGIGQSFSSVQVLNIETLQWRTIPSMNFKRVGHTMENLNGVITVFGGRNGFSSGDSAQKRTLEKFDGSKWTLEQMQFEHLDHASALVPCD